MKLRSLHFLSKANVKGNKSNRAVTILICLLIIAVTLISSYSIVTVEAVNSYKKDYRARALEVLPFLGPVTEEIVDAVSSAEHVELVTDSACMYPLQLRIKETTDTAISEKLELQEAYVNVDALFEGEEKRIIKGKSLDDAPVFSCLVPSIFYPYMDDFERGYKDLEYIDGRTLIGKTLTVNGYEGKIDFTYNMPKDDGQIYTELTQLRTTEMTLEVVGVYPCSNTTSGYYGSVFVSHETKRLMLEMFMKETGIDPSGDSHMARYWNDPSLHTHLVVVDDYSNIPDVVNYVRHNLECDISGEPLRTPRDSTIILANLFKTVGTFLTLAIVVVSVILLVQSSSNAITEHKGYIGLMKAIGYKNRQIFAVLLWEQMYLSLRAFLVGGAVSTLAAFLINLKFEHGTFNQLMYLMDWKIYFFFLGVSALIALLVPVVTELFMLNKLLRIEPREAMSVK